MHPPDAITVRACAKVNLALATAPPETDGPRAGWHRIATWMHAIDLCDTLTVEATGPTSFDLAWQDSDEPIDWPIGRDLVARAHALLERHAARALPTRITLRKSVPNGAGLGGGSADAGAALCAIRTLHELDLDHDALRELSLELGSDVPYFVDVGAQPRAALVEGFGERVARIATAQPDQSGLLLLLPAFECATPDVYRAFDELPPPSSSFADRAERVRTLTTARLTPNAPLFNDLEPAAIRVEPRVGRVLALARHALPRSGVHMTGSGAACFALVEPTEANAAAEALREAYKRDAPELGVRVLPTALQSPGGDQAAS